MDKFVAFLSIHKKKILICGSAAVFASFMYLAYALAAQLASLEGRIEGHNWVIPSTLYADGPSLYPGMPVSRQWLLEYLHRLNYDRSSGPDVQAAQYRDTHEGVLFCRRSGASEHFPVMITFNRYSIRRISNFKTGKEVRSLSLEPIPIAYAFGRTYDKRELVKRRELPLHLIHAVLAAEDRRYYSHNGVDPKAILRALWHNTFEKGQIQGGSTITQQLVKNLHLTPEKSIRRKVKEAVMARMMEKKFGKEEILERYLNEVYLGQQGSISIRGIGEGSRLYFRKDARYLSIPEATLLAGMIRSPHKYDPYRYPEKAMARRNYVLSAMKQLGWLTAEQYERFAKSPLEVQQPEVKINTAPYFAREVEKQLREIFSTREIQSANYEVFTTLNYDMQLAAEEALSKGLAAIDKVRFAKLRKKVQGCLIAVEPSTGYIRAFVGGRDYSDSQFDRVSQAFRQPGSSFKPFVYATALETAFRMQQHVYTPATLIADEPWSLQLDDSVWKPVNYNGNYHGIVSMREALAHSMNIATARLAYAVGLSNITAVSHDLGLNRVKAYPSLSLGAFEVSPWQLIEAYTVFANRGTKVELSAIKEVRNARGEILLGSQTQSREILHEQTAYLVTDMLKTVVTSGTGAGVQKWGFKRAVAGKTGTTDDFRDAWFIGYTPDLICLVWVGYDDNTPLRMNGAQAALPIWATFMKKATAGMPVRDFAVPAGIVERVIDPSTGMLATDECSTSMREVFIRGTEPTEFCSSAHRDFFPEFTFDPSIPG